MFLRYLYALPEFVAALLALGIIVMLLQRRLRSQLPGLTTFILFIAATALWSFSIGMGTLSTSYAGQYLWSRFAYFGIAPLMPLWCVFVWRYTGWRGGISWSKALWFFTVPLATILLVWTNDLHHWHWSSAHLNQALVPPMLETPRGPWFWFVHLPYSYGLLLLATLILLRSLRGSPKTYRNQLAFLLLASAFPFLGNAVYIAGFQLLGSVDPTPLTFVLSGCIVVFALFRYHLLNLAPIAYQAVFESLPDSVIVLNTLDQIVDMNPAAEAVLGQSKAKVLGNRIQSLFHNWDDLMSQFLATKQIRLSQHEPAPINHDRYLDVRVAPLRNHRQEFVGRVIIAQDISQRLAFEEQAHHDPLTNLANRRSFQVQGVTMLETAKREGWSTALLYLDLDKFKAVNDSFGHEIGDLLLQKAALRLKETLRTTDVLARIGGDEFVLLLPRASSNDIADICMRLLSDMRQPFNFTGHQLGLEVSIGVAFYPDHANDLEELLKRADSAMYAAKSAKSGFTFYSMDFKSTRL